MSSVILAEFGTPGRKALFFERHSLPPMGKRSFRRFDFRRLIKDSSETPSLGRRETRSRQNFGDDDAASLANSPALVGPTQSLPPPLFDPREAGGKARQMLTQSILTVWLFAARRDRGGCVSSRYKCSQQTPIRYVASAWNVEGFLFDSLTCECVRTLVRWGEKGNCCFLPSRSTEED